MRSHPTALDRFWSKVDKTPTCWLWKACVLAGPHGGYGLFHDGTRVRRVHRFAYEVLIGPIPPGAFILHLCNVKLCVRPDHLKAGTHAENMRQMVESDRQATGARNGALLHPETRARGSRHGSQTHPESQPRGERHGSALLTEKDVVAILETWRRGQASQAALGRRFGVGLSTIHDIIRGHSWKHLSETPLY